MSEVPSTEGRVPSDDLYVWGWDPNEKKPNPGSIEAHQQGCTCARMDNGLGRGYRYYPEQPARSWVTNDNCPLHGAGR